jgi:hypothetical protein
MAIDVKIQQLTRNKLQRSCLKGSCRQLAICELVVIVRTDIAYRLAVPTEQDVSDNKPVSVVRQKSSTGTLIWGQDLDQTLVTRLSVCSPLLSIFDLRTETDKGSEICPE